MQTDLESTWRPATSGGRTGQDQSGRFRPDEARHLARVVREERRVAGRRERLPDAGEHLWVVNHEKNVRSLPPFLQRAEGASGDAVRCSSGALM